jgi:diguanylate cyclase (GGDEF)-like protein
MIHVEMFCDVCDVNVNLEKRQAKRNINVILIVALKPGTIETRNTIQGLAVIPLQHLRVRIASWIAPELREQRDQAIRSANIDPLTGIANRRAFELAQTNAELEQDTCIILFDANNFGRVNKVSGHQAGDALLCTLAQSLRDSAQAFGVGSRVFRIGGDEFAIIAPCGLAISLRDHAEINFGAWRSAGNVLVTVSGTIGTTLQDADRELQSRKRQRKEASIIE